MEHAPDHERGPDPASRADPDPRSTDDEERSPVISEGLRHLFPTIPTDEDGTEREQSTHFDAFLAGIASRTAPAATGAPALDRLLAGGLRPGLWLVRSARVGLATAFLDGLVWASVATGRPVVFYSLRTGIQRTWERLLAEFGDRLGDPVDLAALRASHVAAECVEHARRLDAGMMRRLFPLLTLEDALPTESRSLLGFLSHLEDLLGRSERAPILLVDALAQLAVLVGLSTGRSVALFSETDDMLGRHGAVGVITADATLEAPLLAAASGALDIRGATDAAAGDAPMPTVPARIELLASRWNAAPSEVDVTLTLDVL